MAVKKILVGNVIGPRGKSAYEEWLEQSGNAGKTFDDFLNYLSMSVPNADWEQNDENGPGYIKNKPFYEYEVNEVIFDGDIAIPEGSGGITGYYFESPLNIVNGEEYLMQFDDMEAIHITAGTTSYAFKNVAQYIALYSNSITFGYYRKNEYHVKISSLNTRTAIKQLDEKFISYKPGMKVENGGEIFNDYANNTASAIDSHAEGRRTKAVTRQAHAEGDCTVAGNVDINTSDASPIGDYPSGTAAHSEGIYTNAKGTAAHSEGYKSRATGNMSHAEGYETIANGICAHAEGEATRARTVGSHAEGKNTEAGEENGQSYCHAEGVETKAYGRGSHAEGDNTVAEGQYSHAEGGACQAIGDYSHAEGCNDGHIYTITNGKAAHAEGIGTWAIGDGSHSEGRATSASRAYAHAEGQESTASGVAAHAEGTGTIANVNSQHAQGKYNVEDTAGKYAHIVGGGTSDTNRKNIHTIDWDGNAEFAGDVIARGCNGENPVSLLNLAESVSNNISQLSSEIAEIPKIKFIDKIINGNPNFANVIGSVKILSMIDNTVIASMPHESCIGVYITNKVFNAGRSYKIVLDIETSNPLITFSLVSLKDITVNNWSVGIIGKNERKIIVDYDATVNGDLGIYAYGDESEVKINVKVFDITDIPKEYFNNVDFYSIDDCMVYMNANEADYAKKAGSIAEIERGIACIGDSLTYGYGALPGSSDYPSILAKLCDKTVYNLGVSGEATNEILARHGGYPAKVNPFIIPADVNAVEISFNDTINIGAPNPTTLLDKSSSGIVNPVIIDGIEGIISKSEGSYYFTRSVLGEAHEITRPCHIITKEMREHKEDIQVIFVGTNGGWMITADDAETRIKKLISQIDMMIDYNTSKKYIIIGLHYFYSWVLYNGLTKEKLENELKLKYGNHFINLRKYMIEYGLSDAGLSPTEADNTAIENGEVPPSLLFSDGIHGNAKFYNILANLVHKKGLELGYWS